MLLLIDAGIHAYEVIDADVPFLVGGFIATAVGAVAGAYLLLTSGPRLGWVLGGLTTLLTSIGYIVTRATPVPTDEDDYGNWLEPLGLTSLILQIVVVALAVWALTGRHGLRPAHLVQEGKAVTPGMNPDEPGPQRGSGDGRPPRS
ncbi:hypothetical protein [Streptomyces montanisoli]|uniref:Uncharacterized protein n=1 Tax=Streptomyces montanisoli TaxID=2798581 RepID=A0A940MBT7_9ACTN|nr:hypothetical protein [Streptomyces montanisoli]MBP0457130.1 hypothetical protein [Streptomyces montanisoli]